MEISINDSTGEVEIVKLQNTHCDSSKKCYLDKKLFQYIEKNTNLKMIEGTEIYFVELSLIRAKDDQLFLEHNYIDDSDDANMDERNINFLPLPVFWYHDEQTNSTTLKQY
ncbi:hypothetical protein [Nostoc sp. 'Peltigera membranacea cyanobiont' N6]|nr:hypothetical protein [Nostoc sp. 'Peltigera membranacea cyanobiont' N6]AVH62684.1 hypothetical protein NPM_0828 [Nostoc sp. 'Peltigera membranacea cyanobiont' N6]